MKLIRFKIKIKLECLKNDTKLLEDLIANGSDIEAKDGFGETALIFGNNLYSKPFYLLFLIFFDTFAALKLGLTEIAKVLIKNKANVNARNLNNETALHFGNIISKDSSSF